jgi:hypothetical protein
VNVNPIRGSLTTIALQTIQTANARKTPGLISRDCAGQYRGHRPSIAQRLQGFHAVSIFDMISLLNSVSDRPVQADKRVRAVSGFLFFHVTDRKMHPCQGYRNQQEKQHETACPDIGKVIQNAKT